VTQLQQLCGRKPETIRRLLDGLDPVHRDGRSVHYDSRAALDRIYGGEGLNPAAQRARHDAARADLAELDLKERLGDLVPRADVEEALLAVTSPIALRLDALATKAAPEARATRSDAEAEAIIKRFVDEARTEIADAGLAFASRSPRRRRARARSLAPAASAAGVAVGGPGAEAQSRVKRRAG
jgi:hypothetical protein